MTTPHITDIQVGWRVFAGSEEVGEVTRIDDDGLDVGRGRIRHHDYHFPRTLIKEALDGVVDLDLDPGAVDEYESGRQPDPEQLPDEYRRLEFGQDVPERIDPIDTQQIVK